VGSRVGLNGRGKFRPLRDSIPEPSSRLSYPGPHLDLRGEVTRGWRKFCNEEVREFSYSPYSLFVGL